MPMDYQVTGQIRRTVHFQMTYLVFAVSWPEAQAHLRLADVSLQM